MKLRMFEHYADFLTAAQELLVAQLAAADEAAYGIMLSGGSTPMPVYRALAEEPVPVSEKAHLLFSDERVVSDTSPDSNYGNTKPMIKALGVPDSRVLKVTGETGSQEAADHYEADLQTFLEGGGTIPLAILGIGADGHTASLFTLDAAQRGTGRLAIPAHRESGPDRVSVTSDLLSQVGRIVFWVAGEGKSAIVKQFEDEPESIPAGVAVKNAAVVELWFCPKV